MSELSRLRGSEGYGAFDDAIETSQVWLKPLYRLIRQHLIGLDVIHADKTVVQVHREEGKANASESRMWVYASRRYSKEQIRFFEYQPDRSGKHPAALLKDFKGCLITDGYAGYEKVPHAVRCGCWAHMRRKWADLPPFQREVMRQMKAEPLLDAYWAWVEKLAVLRYTEGSGVQRHRLHNGGDGKGQRPGSFRLSEPASGWDSIVGQEPISCYFGEPSALGWATQIQKIVKHLE